MSTIYLSSTYEDLKEYREAAGRALRRLQHQVIGMEDYVASDERPLERCLKDVQRCDIYVGLFAHRYGFIPKDGNPQGLSITELEYREAERLNKPRLIFLVDEDEPWRPRFIETESKIKAFREELKQAKLTSFFKNPQDLATHVLAAVALRTEQPVPAPPRPVAPEPRQIVFDLYLAHGGTDAGLVESLRNDLLPDPDHCVVRPSARGLFAATAQDFVDLETDLCRAAVAAVLVSPVTLDRMEENRSRTELVLETLRARTGAVVALAPSADCVARASAWPFAKIFDLSEYTNHPAEVVRWLKPALKELGTVLVPPAIGVPWMVVAMTKSEAAALAADPSMVPARMRERFDVVRNGLKDGWVERYGDRRDQWRPPSSATTIAGLSQEAMGGLVSLQNAKLRGRRIRLQYYPFEVPARDELRPVYRMVAQKGCVVIVDELSLFHPDVQDALQPLPMIQEERAAIITVSPFEHYALQPHQVVWQELKQRLSGAFDRFTISYDSQCELSVGDEVRLRRWLHQSLPQTVETLRNPPPNPDALLAFAAEENLQADGTTPSDFYGRGGIL